MVSLYSIKLRFIIYETINVYYLFGGAETCSLINSLKQPLFRICIYQKGYQKLVSLNIICPMLFVCMNRIFKDDGFKD